jgi:hypothetical protein
MAVHASDEASVLKQEGVAHRVAQRRANERKAAQDDLPTDPQGLIELACECSRSDCERSVKVPLYVYRRMVEAGDQYLLQAGHHAFEQYRTIVSLGLVRIEERV